MGSQSLLWGLMAGSVGMLGSAELWRGSFRPHCSVLSLNWRFKRGLIRDETINGSRFLACLCYKLVEDQRLTTSLNRRLPALSPQIPEGESAIVISNHVSFSDWGSSDHRPLWLLT